MESRLQRRTLSGPVVALLAACGPSLEPERADVAERTDECVRAERPIRADEEDEIIWGGLAAFREIYSEGVEGEATTHWDAAQLRASFSMEIDASEAKYLEVVQRPAHGRQACSPKLRLPYSIVLEVDGGLIFRAEGVMEPPPGAFTLRVVTPTTLDAESSLPPPRYGDGYRLDLKLDLVESEFHGKITAPGTDDGAPAPRGSVIVSFDS